MRENIKGKNTDRMKRDWATMSETEEKAAEDEYRLLLDLWKSENSIKTTKLQVLLATNAILASAFFLSGQVIWIALVGSIFSAIWLFSIGRTVSYQEHWQSMLENIRKNHSSNHMFQIHSTKFKPAIWGRIPSKYYLLGTPIGAAIVWLAVFILKAI